MEWLSKSFRLDTDVIQWLEELKDDYGSVNKGLRAMMAVNEGVERGVSRATRERLNASARPATISPTLPPHQPDDAYNIPINNRPKNAHCKHCGSRFAGAKFATICPDCKSSGHTLTPAECPVCGEGRGI